MALVHSPRIVTDDLILCLDAANRESYPGSGTVWRDLAGSNNGTLVNGPTFNSANAGSIVFDGSNDFVRILNSSTLNMGGKSFTADFWIAITNFSSGERIIFEYNIWSASDTYQLTTYGNTIRINFPSAFSAGKKLDYIYTPLTTNIWTNIVGQFDTINNNITLFINGLQVAQMTNVTQEIGSAVSNFHISSRGGTSLFLPCRISSIKMYDRTLTPTEIQQNYNALKGRFNL